MNQTPTPPDLTAQLRLRPSPRPTLRLSRKALITGGAVLACGVGAALALGLAPPAKPKAKVTAEQADTRTPRSTERLNLLPKTYAEVPQLGPPLPGDLGKPMLSARMVAPGVSSAPVMTGVPAPAASFARQAPPSSGPDQALQSARRSALFGSYSGSSSGGRGGSEDLNLPSSSQGMLAALPSLGAVDQPEPQADRQREFLMSPPSRTMVSSERLTAPASPYILQAGSVFAAALITGIRSDLPGQVTAQVTQDIYDSLGRGYLLVPQGSRLIGQYDNAVAFGQSRVLLAWRRLILPNGRSILLDDSGAADVAGQAGLEDKTDYHWSSMLKAAALSTLLSIGSQAGASDNDDEIVRALREGAGDSINRTGQRMVERQLNVAPTLTIRPGFRVRVILSKDLVLEPYEAR